MDFVSMFWQIPLAKESRRLFAFYAGDLGTFQFNRVAMGALNSSIYTQRMVTQMFDNVRRKDGRPLLGNGLMVQTDDILLHAQSEEEMLEVLELCLKTIASHNMAIHPGKCEFFVSETIYCGLHVSRQGITVDPARVQGIVNMPEPRTVGDVWKFHATAGWVREDIPLFSQAASQLSEFVTEALKNKPRRNMRAAEKIKLSKTAWSPKHLKAWNTVKQGILTAVTTSYRDKQKKACLFTDASATGWAYVVTQCDEDELEKPWSDQKHEILAVNSGKFRASQVFWSMSCKEAYPIRWAVERHRRLLEGNVAFAQTTDIMCKVRTYDINGQTLRSAEFRQAVPVLFGLAGIHLQTAVNSLLSGTDFLPTHAPTHPRISNRVPHC